MRFRSFVLFPLLSCFSHDLVVPTLSEEGASNEEIPLSLERDLDFLVVIDNSNSMLEEQSRLTNQFEKLMFALADLEGGFPNAHIGVVSSNLGVTPYSITGGCETPDGDRGCLLCMARESCTPPTNCDATDRGGFINVTNKGGILDANIEDVATPILDTADSDGDGNTAEIVGCKSATIPGKKVIDACDIADVFRCIAKLGGGGCGFEQHLEAVTRTLTSQAEGSCYGGFIRENALLTVLVLADEDDCSAQDGAALYDPTNQGVDDPMGPLQSFRCFEFGVNCDQAVTRSAQTLTGCQAMEDADCEARFASVGHPDCYLYPPSHYAEQFYQLASGNTRPQGKLFFTVIGGPWNPNNAVSVEPNARNEPKVQPTSLSCQSPEYAVPGIRLRAVAELLAKNGDGLYAADRGVNICADDYTPALEELSDRIRSRLMPGCIANPLTNREGRVIAGASEAECTVQDVQNRGSDNEESTELPRCQFNATSDDCPSPDKSPGGVTNWDSEGAAAGACWYVCNSTNLKDPCQLCDSPACAWQFHVCRDAQCLPTTTAPENTTAVLSCQTCRPEVPGCLCGDGVCQEDLDENAVTCSDDCK